MFLSVNLFSLSKLHSERGQLKLGFVALGKLTSCVRLAFLFPR